MEKVLVRPIQVEDISSVAALLSDAFYTEGWLGWASPFMRLGLYQDLRGRCLAPPPQYVCLVGLRTRNNDPLCTTIVGTVEVAVKPLLWSMMSTPVSYVSNLAVARASRRQGVGKQLLLACEQIVQGWGSQEIFLHVKGENQSARRLYTGLNYRLHRTEVPILARLLGHPQQLLLRKALTRQTPVSSGDQYRSFMA
jgi:ribosomal protein S18 acetylase RimI-like enzyme